LYTECSVVGGVHPDDVARDQMDFGVGAQCADDGFADSGFDFGFGCAEGYQDAGWPCDAGGPGVAVGGGDDAPFCGLPGGQYPFGECLCAGFSFPGTSSALQIPGAPVALWQALFGAGLVVPGGDELLFAGVVVECACCGF
jgi:hypothetical protein